MEQQDRRCIRGPRLPAQTCVLGGHDPRGLNLWRLGEGRARPVESLGPKLPSMMCLAGILACKRVDDSVLGLAVMSLSGVVW